MRGTVRVMLSLLLVLNSTVAIAGPSVQQILQYHLAKLDFSDLYAAVSSGSYDGLEPNMLVLLILDTEGGLSPVEREALVEYLLIRPLSGSSSRGSMDSATDSLVRRLEEFHSPTLRARVLLLADESGSEGISEAVLNSAQRMATLLSGGSVPQGYAVEAMAIAEVAPHYPSVAMAELLRIIAAGSGDRRVAEASRRAARDVLERL